MCLGGDVFGYCGVTVGIGVIYDEYFKVRMDLSLTGQNSISIAAVSTGSFVMTTSRTPYLLPCA